MKMSSLFATVFRSLWFVGLCLWMGFALSAGACSSPTDSEQPETEKAAKEAATEKQAEEPSAKDAAAEKTPEPAPEPAPDTGPVVSYKKDILPIYKSCAPFCHGGDNTYGKLDLLQQPYKDTVNKVSSMNAPQKLIEPGKPEESFLYDKIANKKPAVGEKMPPGEYNLDPEKIDLVRRWILQGAKNN